MKNVTPATNNATDYPVLDALVRSTGYQKVRDSKLDASIASVKRNKDMSNYDEIDYMLAAYYIRDEVDRMVLQSLVDYMNWHKRQGKVAFE